VKSFHVVPTRLLDPKRGATRGFESVTVKEKSTSEVVMPKVKKRLEGGTDGPLFLYMHWMDAHSPYDLAGTEGTPKEAYLREVAVLDERLGELVAWLDEKNLKDRTTIIITADHGESFGDHGTWEHGKTVYEELLRVPMWIISPGEKPRTVDTPVSTIDLGATVLDLFGRPTPGHFMGQSLLPLAFGKAKKVDHPIAAEAGHKLRAFYSTKNLKVIFDRARKTTEVYDLGADPKETKNIADTPAAKSHISRARRFFKAHQVAEEAKR
jgi:arylsulfatase A-like enzyme